jgi:hypothetical protein
MKQSGWYSYHLQIHETNGALNVRDVSQRTELKDKTEEDAPF